LPSVAITGGYVAADVPRFLTVYNAINVGIGVNYSLSSLWKTNAKVVQAKAREKELEASQSQLSDAIKLAVGKAYLNYISSNKKIDVYRVAVEQAEENYRITKNKFDNSLATTTDLLDAEVAQLQARLNYSFAKSDAAVAYKRLQQETGTLETTTNK
jgi:outer membrane protein